MIGNYLCTVAKQKLLLAGILFGIFCASAWAETRTNNLTPLADAFVRDGTYAQSNFGTASILELKTGADGTKRDVYLKFDLKDVWKVQSATFRFFAALISKKPNLSTTAFAVTDTNWTETAITWNNRPDLGSAQASVTVTGNSYAWYTLDLSSYIRSQRASGSDVVSLSLHNLVSTDTQMIDLYSKEAANNRPQLIVISTNTPPAVTLTEPANNSILPPTTTVLLSASATDPDGSIARVDFYAGTNLLISTVSPPYSYSWPTIATGAYELRAVATDNDGLSTTSTVVNIKVGMAPVVSLANPPNGASFAAPADILLAAHAADADADLSQVNFYSGTDLIASVSAPPYTCVWSNVVSGTHALRAVAIDAVGLSTTSSVVQISIVAPPEVALSSPANNAVFANPATVTMTASVADSDGSISRVDFYAGTNRIASRSTPPYTCVWSNVSNGTYSLWAVAADTSGLLATSKAITIRVTSAPQVSLTSPTNNSVFFAPANVSLSANASDGDGTISLVDFYEGDTWLASVAAPPYAFAWSNVSAGTYSLRAVAMDNAGLATTSSVANLAVSPFLVTLTSPSNNAFFSEPAAILLAATTTGNSNPIMQMDFYSGFNRLATVTAPPYTYNWTGVTQGTYAVQAAAMDVTGLSSTSSIVTVTVGAPLTVTLVEPTNQSNFAVAETLNLKATASSSNGPIRIEFFDGTNKVGESASNPGVFAWQVTTVGAHSLTAELTDGFGQVATSPSVLIQVTDADSDYDGRSNAQELADGTDPFSASSVRPVLLGSWAFDTSAFLGDQGQVPLYKNGALLVPSWNSNAVAIGTGAGVGLTYRDVETNFQANINCRNGTVRFWFKPNWNSSANGITGGPRTDARLIELGGYGLPEGWWALGINPDGTLLNFSSTTNLQYTSYVAHPINWKSNRWYQLTLTYTTDNTLLYLNGELVAAGRGVQSWPSARIRAYGFRLGLDWYGGQSPNGQFENLETFNYPLDPQTVAHEFPNHQLPAGIVDSDYDGRSDFLETQVDKTDPNNSNDAVPVRLGYWRFDSTDWHGELGQLPLATNGVVASSSWSGTAANVSQAGGSGLIYRDQETNGWANINCRNGSVLFWFKPNWNSGLNGGPGGTGTAARLLEMGDPNSSEGWWALSVNSNATQLAFSTMSKLTPTAVLSSPIHWNSNQWYQLALTYSPTNSALYLNGTLAASGLGVPSFPSASQRANGFRIGAGVQPGQSANGLFDELQTFNYPVATSLIAAEVGNVEAIDSNGDGTPDVLQELPLTANAPFSATPFVITGAIEAEQFDLGGNGIGYASQTNAGTTDYRTTSLAIEPCTDLGGGYCVSHLQAGDWMKYTFETRLAGDYTFEVRVNSDTPGGQMLVQLGKANGVAGYQSPAQQISASDWHGVTFRSIHLDAGTNTLKLLMTANSPEGSVGRVNYISIYPSVPPFVPGADPLVLDVTQSPYGAIGDGNTNHASLNRIAFQKALNDLMAHPGGGTLFVPAGTYFLDKNPANNPGEDPTKSVGNNYSLFLGRPFGDTRPLSGIEIRGDLNGETVLEAYDRTTTLLYVKRFWGTDPASLHRNFSFNRLSFKGRPHIRPDGSYDPGAFHNYAQNSSYSYGLGSLLVFMSDEIEAPLSDVNVSQCSFINPTVYGIVIGNSKNMAFTGNRFHFWDGEPLPVASTNLYDSTNGSPVGQVGIFGSGSASINIVVLSNSFDGNPALEALSQDYSSDGLLWLQAGGNWFAGDNSITNYGLEAIQYNAGPGAAVGNRFVTTQRSDSTGALIAFGSGWRTLSSVDGGPNEADEFFTFSGNHVTGGRFAYFGTSAWQQYTDPLYDVYYCGNDAELDPPQTGGALSRAAFLSNCRQALVSGNTLRAGALGVSFRLVHVGTELLKNNFSAATHASLLYEILPGYLQSVSITKNQLDSGDSSHLQLPYADSFNFFLVSNSFFDALGNPNALLLNPPGAPIHFWP